MNIAFEVDEEYFKSLMNKLNTQDPLAVISLSLASLDWIASEKSKGKGIFSKNSEGGDIVKMILPELEKN